MTETRQKYGSPESLFSHFEEVAEGYVWECSSRTYLLLRLPPYLCRLQGLAAFRLGGSGRDQIIVLPKGNNYVKMWSELLATG